MSEGSIPIPDPLDPDVTTTMEPGEVLPQSPASMPPDEVPPQPDQTETPA